MAATVLTDKLDDLFNYVQERCLWQFYSRTWDRTENIDGIVAQATLMFQGLEPKRETPIERLHLADAKLLVDDCRARYDWLKDVAPEEIRQLMGELRTKLTDVAITRSRNRELNHSLY